MSLKPKILMTLKSDQTKTQQFAHQNNRKFAMQNRQAQGLRTATQTENPNVTQYRRSLMPRIVRQNLKTIVKQIRPVEG